MSVLLKTIQSIPPTKWDLIKPKTNPFLHHAFFEALELSGSVGKSQGWEPLYFKEDDSLLYSFSKTNSYGEYIFDWAWADAYARSGHAYYPKLTSMVPFTPVTSGHFLMPIYDAQKATSLLKAYDAYYEANGYSSSHFLFLETHEVDVFKEEGYTLRDSLQYHFVNEGYANFEDFLKTLRHKKANNIKRERVFPASLVIKVLTGSDLTEGHARQMYQFYLSTIDKKNSQTYLNENFFERLFATMKNNLLYVEASHNQIPLAGSLFLYDDAKLYGRYWGSVDEFKHLHFELCYYQGIDFCIAKKLKVFEAGAQGEHKIARGFRPVKTLSAHKIKDARFKAAIDDFIIEERAYLERAMRELSKKLPFKHVG